MPSRRLASCTAFRNQATTSLGAFLISAAPMHGSPSVRGLYRRLSTSTSLMYYLVVLSVPPQADHIRPAEMPAILSAPFCHLPQLSYGRSGGVVSNGWMSP
jgi:hypothetical protein